MGWPPPRATGLAGALLLSLAFAGCSPCVERCRVESRNLNRCLDDWGLGWADVGANDAADFRGQCVQEQSRWLEGLDEADRADEQALCLDLNNALRAVEDCDRVKEALDAFGGDGA